MIKLIATDMDGTLLDENGKIPKDFFKTVAELKKKNINFIVASGRSYSTLVENFKPYSDQLYFICDNGGYIVENGKLSSVSIIEKRLVNLIVEECAKIPDIHILLCGLKSNYHLSIPAVYKKEVDKYYVTTTIVDNLNNIDDDIFKITVCDKFVSSEHSFKLLEPKFKDNLLIVQSGEHWLDVTNLGINKGAALEEIQKRDNIDYEETMVFGDYFNDVTMLSKAKYSFVMANAPEAMRQYGNYTAKANTENGVIEAIKQYVLT